MPNDAKLGLVVGVGIVLALGVLCSRKEPAATTRVRPGGAAVRAISPAAPERPYRLTHSSPPPTDEGPHIADPPAEDPLR
jgi:hypothetical protein